MATGSLHDVQSGPRYTVHRGVQNPPADQWAPLEWIEPGLGKQVHGEVTISRPEGTSGSLQAGFWRTGPTAPGANADGSHTFVSSSPLGDELACVIDGSATLAVISTGESFRVGPGSVINAPKGLEVRWDIEAPAFKMYWCIWNGTEATANPPQDLKVTNISDNPDDWEVFPFVEPQEGALIAGDYYAIRAQGSTGSFMSAVWRSGRGIAGSFVDENGTLTTPYTCTNGDETILLLEGEVDVIETESGRKHSFRAGDVIGLSAGQHITWISKGPFCKKLSVVSRDRLPE